LIIDYRLINRVTILVFKHSIYSSNLYFPFAFFIFW